LAETRRDTADPEIMLGLLTSIERDSGITQRKLAGDLGIAYYLTPQGFGEKSRLTAEYLAVSFNFFLRARADCAALFERCAAAGWRNTALYGAGDLAEIAILSAGEARIEAVCVIDPAPRPAAAAPGCRWYRTSLRRRHRPAPADWTVWS
jgi:hypothetical protein